MIMYKFLNYTKNYIISISSMSFLIFLVVFFYQQITSEKALLSIFLLGLLFLSASTDGFILLIHLFRKHVKHKRLSFDPSKLTIIIACYNGENVIGETLRQAITHVPPSQIIVVSDASTDNTEEVARSYGVRVFRNEYNLNKALSISNVVKHVKTPYTLILDDDTHIEKTFIPTSLLDEGYAAVAFNVMPEKTGTLINKFQQFEYRTAMILGKGLRASVGAISNVSGAIGLFRTSSLIDQESTHSGQFGGEDQQRTMLVHLSRSKKSKGVTYTNSTVYTEAPDTFKQFIKQRSLSWNCSTEETFFLCVKIIINPKTHFLLKLEKIYLLFLLFTDPLRMLLWIFLFFHPISIIIISFFYIFIETLAWFKTGRKDPYWIILLFPFFSMLRSVTRFIAHFWWFKLKYDYVIKNKFHKLVRGRKLLFEYSIISLVIIVLWIISLPIFYNYLKHVNYNIITASTLELQKIW